MYNSSYKWLVQEPHPFTADYSETARANKLAEVLQLDDMHLGAIAIS